MSLRGRILQIPFVYESFQKLIGADSFRAWLVKNYVQPGNNLSILDVGCGPGSLYPFCREISSSYSGYDTQPGYIEYARKKYAHEKAFEIHLGEFNEERAHSLKDRFDRILLIGLLHHLSDTQSMTLLKTLKSCLKTGGFILTMDPCRSPHAGFFERWIISNDRGEFIRNEEAYRQLANVEFPDLKQSVVNGKARIPSHANLMQLYKN